MIVAEALIERADLQKRVEYLRQRIEANARSQEGERPAEDAAALQRECTGAIAQLSRCVRRPPRHAFTGLSAG